MVRPLRGGGEGKGRTIKEKRTFVESKMIDILLVVFTWFSVKHTTRLVGFSVKYLTGYQIFDRG